MHQPAECVADEGDHGDFEQRMRHVDARQKRLRSSGLPSGRIWIADLLRPSFEAGRGGGRLRMVVEVNGLRA